MRQRDSSVTLTVPPGSRVTALRNVEPSPIATRSGTRTIEVVSLKAFLLGRQGYQLPQNGVFAKFDAPDLLAR